MPYTPDQPRTIRRLSALGVVLAFVLQTLAWSMMPVYASSTDDEWIVICTSEGMQWIPLSTSGIQSDGSTQNNPVPTIIEHCDLCVFAHSLGMAPASAGLLLHNQGYVRVLPVYTPMAAVASNSHTPQQPRAPPVYDLI